MEWWPFDAAIHRGVARFFPFGFTIAPVQRSYVREPDRNVKNGDQRSSTALKQEGTNVVMSVCASKKERREA